MSLYQSLVFSVVFCGSLYVSVSIFSILYNVLWIIVCLYQSLVFCVMFCGSLYVSVSIFSILCNVLWIIVCLSVFFLYTVLLFLLLRFSDKIVLNYFQWNSFFIQKSVMDGQTRLFQIPPNNI